MSKTCEVTINLDDIAEAVPYEHAQEFILKVERNMFCYEFTEELIVKLFESLMIGMYADEHENARKILNKKFKDVVKKLQKEKESVV